MVPRLSTEGTGNVNDLTKSWFLNTMRNQARLLAEMTDPGLGQEKEMMNLENFVVPESKEVLQERWGCVRV